MTSLSFDCLFILQITACREVKGPRCCLQGRNGRAGATELVCSMSPVPPAQSDLIDISGPAAKFLCLHWPHGAETTKKANTSTMWVWKRKDAREYWLCRATGDIRQVISVCRKDAWSLWARRGWFLKEESLRLPRHIPFTSQRDIFGYSHSWAFSFCTWSGVTGLIWERLRWIRCCGRGDIPAGTKLTWAGWGLSQAAVPWSNGIREEPGLPAGRQVGMCRLAPWVMASPGELLLLLWALGTPGKAEQEQPAGMARPWGGALGCHWPSVMGTFWKTAKQSDCYLQSNKLAGQRHFKNWPF